MDYKHGIKITSRDMIFKAWKDSMALVDQFRENAKEIDNESLVSLFEQFAEDEGVHASRFLELLHKYEQ